MAKLAPPKSSPVQITKETDQQITQTLRAMLKEVITDGDEYMTIGQGLAKRLVNIALYAENNNESIKAIKEINDRVEGKATIVQRDEKKQLPRIIIAMDGDELETVNQKLRNAKAEDFEDDDIEEEGFLIESDDGQEYIL